MEKKENKKRKISLFKVETDCDADHHSQCIPQKDQKGVSTMIL